MPHARNRSLALLVLLPVLLLDACSGGDRPFSPEEWQSLRQVGTKGGRMVAMAESLIRDGSALGLNPSEVLALLGEDDDATGRGRAGELEWVIDEGIMSCTVLRLNFGADRRVHEVFTVDITY